MTAPMQIYADTMAGALLAAITNATMQEHVKGFPGWVQMGQTPWDNECREALRELEGAGLVEPRQDYPGWWRATAKALAAIRIVGLTEGSA